ncbi:MAG: YbaB/EbfC family nucleoid-associated protein [Candidatus Hydrogenedentes bacterium]|nr:YbaB/EbfC family nucleoid-associated protein [Candidatus Hydrogenedentota bacterium]
MAGMMKKAMEMKAKVEQLRDSLEAETIEASAGGGMVTVVVNGKFKVVSIRIEPEVVDKDGIDVLETLVRAAVNEAVDRMQEHVKSRMSEITGGLNIPGLT